MSKTPVSALQEYMVKNVLGIPVYDLVAEKTGTQFPSFTYRVKCGEHYSLGTASTKKQAKHNAARELIKCLTAVNDSGSLLKKSITTNNTTQINSYYKPQSNAIAENEVFVNSVGKLNEHCVQHKLQLPQYEVRNMNGPAHMRNFTMTCSIGKLTVEATATTKKQAKHDAAQNMLYALMGDVQKKRDIRTYAEIEIGQLKMLDLIIEKPKRPLVESSEMAKNLYPQLRKKGSVTSVQNIEICDYHRALGGLIDAEKKENLRKEFSRMSSTVSQSEILAKIMKLLDTKVEMTTLVDNQNGWAVDCKLDSIPVLTEIGIGKTLLEAQTKATSNLLNVINKLLA